MIPCSKTPHLLFELPPLSPQALKETSSFIFESGVLKQRGIQNMSCVILKAVMV